MIEMANANKLKNQIFDFMRDQYGALCVRVNSGQSRGYVSSNHWFAPPDGTAHLFDTETVPVLSIDNYMPSKKQTSGFPDTMFLLPNGVAVFVELKTKNDKLSESQLAFIALAESLGHIALAVGSVDDLAAALERSGVNSISGQFRW